MAPGKTDISSGQFKRLSPTSSNASSNKSRGKSAPIERTSQISLSVIGFPAPRSSVPASRRCQRMHSNPQPSQDAEDLPWTPHKVLRDTWIHQKSDNEPVKANSPICINQSTRSPSQHLAKILLQPQITLNSLIPSRPYSSPFLHSSNRIKERNRIKSSMTLKTNAPQKLQTTNLLKQKSSITSSSAGDISSDSNSEHKRPLAPSPPSSESQLNSCQQSSLPGSTPTSSANSSKTNKEIQTYHIEYTNKYSFPVPPLELSNTINSKLKNNAVNIELKSELLKIEENTTKSSPHYEAIKNIKDEKQSSKHTSITSLDVSNVKRSIRQKEFHEYVTSEDNVCNFPDTLQNEDSKHISETPSQSFTDVDLTLMDIQDQVLQLVDSQQACTRSTWLLMQRLSASLDQLNTDKATPIPPTCICPPQSNLPPPVLLMEAAGCARRLADILSLLGAAPQSRDNPDPPLPPTPPPVQSCAPSASQLQQQRTRLRHVSPHTRSGNTNGSLAAILGAVITQRRHSVAPDDTTSGWGSDVSD